MSRKQARDRAGRAMMDRAIARLGVLEYVLLGLAALAALAAGALTGWLLREALGWPFRRTWTVASLVYFMGPGTVAWWKSRRNRLPDQKREDEGRHGG